MEEFTGKSLRILEIVAQLSSKVQDKTFESQEKNFNAREQVWPQISFLKQKFLQLAPNFDVMEEFAVNH